MGSHKKHEIVWDRMIPVGAKEERTVTCTGCDFRAHGFDNKVKPAFAQHKRDLMENEAEAEINRVGQAELDAAIERAEEVLEEGDWIKPTTGVMVTAADLRLLLEAAARA